MSDGHGSPAHAGCSAGMQTAPGRSTRGDLLTIVLSLREEATVAGVIEDARSHYPGADILVVDGESADRTAERARAAGAWVVSVPESLGIAGAMETGLLFARELGYPHIVRLDADGQHAAADIPRLLAPVLEGKADLATGSRFMDRSGPYETSLPRSLGIRLLAGLASSVSGQRISDPTSGLQAMNAAAVRYLTGIEGFEYSEIEALVVLARAGFRIREVPVSMRERQGGRSSFTTARAFYYMFLGMVSALIGALRRPARSAQTDG